MQEYDEMPDFDDVGINAMSPANHPILQPQTKQDENWKFINQPLPNVPEAERTLIGSLFVDNDLIQIAMDILLPEDFYNPNNRKLFEAMRVVANTGRILNPIIVGEELKRANALVAVGGVAQIADMTRGIPYFDEKTVAGYCEEIKKASTARKLLKECNRIIVEVLAGENDIREIGEQAETRVSAIVTNLSNKDEDDGFVPLSRIVSSLGNQFEAYNRGETSGVATGMPEIDAMLDGGGLQPKASYLVAGQEKSGKTSLALDWSYDIAVRQNKGVCVVTAEMMKETLAKRIYSAHSGIPFSLFRPGFKGKMFEKAMAGLYDFGKYPISISDKLRSIPKIIRHLTRAVEQGDRPGKTKIVLGVIDYLQILELSNGTVEGDAKAVEQLSREMKKLASQLDIAIVAMSSLNRVGLTEGQRADTHNLRGSQGLAFDAEAIFIVHNPSYIPGQKYEVKPITDIDLILSRQRNGPTGDIPMKFIGEFMQFMTESQYAKWLNTTGGLDRERHEERMKKDKELDDLW